MDKGNAVGAIVKFALVAIGVLFVMGVVGSSSKQDGSSAPAAVAAPVAAPAPSVPDMAVAVKKKRKRPKAAVAAAGSTDDKARMPINTDDEPYELVK